MFTVCPKCSLKLIVTAADLRVAQGYVRCGRCSNVFNALIGLSDEQQAVLAQENAAIGSAAGPPASAVEEQRAPEGAGSGADVALEFDPSQTDVSEVFIEPQADESAGTGSFESITLRSEAEGEPPAPEAHREAPRAEPSLAPQAAQSGAGMQGEPVARAEERAPGRLTAQAGTRLAQGSIPVRQPAQRAPADSRAVQGGGRAEPRTMPSGPAPQNDGRARQGEPAREPRPERATPAAPAAPRSRTAQGAERGPDRGAPRAARSATPAKVGANATPNAPATDAANVRAQEFEFGPAMPQTPASAGAGEVVRLPRGSHSQRAAIVREAAKRFIQTQRAPRRPGPAVRVPTPPIAPRTEENSPSAAEIVDAFIAPRAPEPQAAPVFAPPDRRLQAAVAALGVLLFAQVVHHYRSVLAEVGWLQAPLAAVYAAIGMPLTPRWDVTAYEVHQLGAVAGEDSPGALTVRASIKNTASRAQPLPLLRVIVQDRFGNRVAARDVPPRAYLPGRNSEHRELAAGQRVDAQVALLDPGPGAVGFEIDACLADAAGHVSCANEAAASGEH
jgi:predicted Zn finger-like uncharacterized protein